MIRISTIKNIKFTKNQKTRYNAFFIDEQHILRFKNLFRVPNFNL